MSLIRIVAALGFVVSGAYAQAPSGAAPAGGGGRGPIVVNTTKLGPNFWALGPFSTVGVFAGPEGIVMVDASGAAQHDAIIDAIKKISPSPIKYMINTHVHADHTGGNELIGKMGITIIARPELREGLAHPTGLAFNGQPAKPAPPAALPTITYSGHMTIRMNGEEVQLIALPPAHTNGDTMIFFPQEDVLMIGDFFRMEGFPNIGLADGGTLNGMIEALGIAAGICGPNTKVVPGHGKPTDRNSIVAQRDMILVLRERVAAMIKEGKTQDEIVAAHPTADYDGKIENVQKTNDRFVTQLYSELKNK